MASENRAHLDDPLHAERSILRFPEGGKAERNKFAYPQSAVANTANIAATATINYAAKLRPFLNDETPASKESKMSDITREEIQAQIAASEARGETKIARFEGKLDLVLSKLDSVNDKMKDVKDDVRSARANQWAIAFGLAVLIVAVAGLFPVFFGLGTQLRDMVHSEVQSQVPSLPASKPQK